MNVEPKEAAYFSGGIVGLRNPGNNCYMNCIVQCLSHTLELTDIFLSDEYSTTVCLGMLFTTAIEIRS